MNSPVSPLKIGQVHALLRQEHPNLELSKIRYYEEMGLVAPARSRKGYRLYSDKDVDCLREAIRLADEEFVPLRVIRVRLMEQGLLKDDHRSVPTVRQVARATQANVVSMAVPAATAVGPTLRAVSDDAAGQPTADATPGSMSANQLLEASAVEPDLLNKILALGLVTPVTRGSDTTFNAGDVRVVQAAASLLRSGAEPRMLGSLRRVVEREVGIIDDLTADLRGAPSTDQEIITVKLDVAREIETLRAELFERALNEYLGL